MLVRAIVSLVITVSSVKECGRIEETDGHTTVLLFLLKVSD